jgi:hypothetical protein
MTAFNSHFAKVVELCSAMEGLECYHAARTDVHGDARVSLHLGDEVVVSIHHLVDCAEGVLALALAMRLSRHP